MSIIKVVARSSQRIVLFGLLCLAVRPPTEAEDAPVLTAGKKGIKITDAQMAALNIQAADFHGEWNCTIAPRRPDG